MSARAPAGGIEQEPDAGDQRDQAGEHGTGDAPAAMDLEGEVELGDGGDDEQPAEEGGDEERGDAGGDDRDRAQDDERDADDQERLGAALQAGLQGRHELGARQELARHGGSPYG